MDDQSVLYFVTNSPSRKGTKKSTARIKVNEGSVDEFLDKLYTFDQCDKYDKFLRELGAKKTVRIKALESKPTIVLSKADQEYVLTTTYPEGMRVKVKFTLGKEFQRRRHHGGFSTSIIEAVENKLVERQTIEGKEVVIVRKFTKNELLVTMEVNGVKCYRFFLPTTSKHSIGTETSRRSFLHITPPPSHATRSRSEVETTLEGYFNEQSTRESNEDVCY